MGQITTIHDQAVDVAPGKTVVLYRNGFCDDVRVFDSGYARDRWIDEHKTAMGRMKTTSFHYQRL